jgi:predicted regulator of Ras-like GTPase activity (Roadblock/LC7/MglB family)
MTNKKRKDELQTTETAEPTVIENATFESTLRANLEEIRNYDGIVGYILKNTNSASIDLKDPAKIIDYAILSSTTFDSTEELSKLFNLEGIKDIIINGKNLKMISLTIEKNRISIFLENSSDDDRVLKRIQMV